MGKKKRVRVSSTKNKSSWITKLSRRPEMMDSKAAHMWGSAWLIVGAILSWYFKVVPNSMFGFEITSYTPLIWVVALYVVMALVMSIIPIFVALLRNRRVSVKELFGRMLFAHWPVTLLMIPAFSDELSQRIAYMVCMDDMVASYKVNPEYTLLMGLIVLMVGCWYLYWSYLAFRKSVQHGGFLTIVCYLISLPLSYVLTYEAMELVSKLMYR